MKHPPMDLSRFAKCTIKKPAICDLLMVDEFRRAVGEFDGEITDEWIVKTTYRLAKELKSNSDIAQEYIIAGRQKDLVKRRLGYYTLHQQEKVFRREYPDYGEEKLP